MMGKSVATTALEFLQHPIISKPPPHSKTHDTANHYDGGRAEKMMYQVCMSQGTTPQREGGEGGVEGGAY